MSTANLVSDVQVSSEVADVVLDTVQETTVQKAKKPTVQELAARIAELEARIDAQADTIEVLMDTIGQIPTTVRKNTGGGSTAPRLGTGVFGYSSTSVLRWMGQQGWTNKQCMGVLYAYGLDVSPATVQTQRQCGRKGTGTVPAFSDVQVAELVSKRDALPNATAQTDTE